MLSGRPSITRPKSEMHLWIGPLSLILSRTRAGRCWPIWKRRSAPGPLHGPGPKGTPFVVLASDMICGKMHNQSIGYKSFGGNWQMGNSRTIVIRTDIGPDRSLRLRVPEEVPVGPAEVVVTIIPEKPRPAGPTGTATDLARSPLFGIWADREDIEDSLTYARQLREQAERRYLSSSSPNARIRSGVGRPVSGSQPISS
jgi:hypothetical protein